MQKSNFGKCLYSFYVLGVFEVFLYTNSFISQHPMGKCISQNGLAYAMVTSNTKISVAFISCAHQVTYEGSVSILRHLQISLSKHDCFSRGRKLGENLGAPALKYFSPKVTHITFTDTSLAKAFHTAASNYKGTCTWK